MKELIINEINNRISERSRLFDMLIDNELPEVGKVIIQSMNEHMAVILALKKILKAELHESNKAKFKELDKKDDAGWDSWYKNNVNK